MKSLLGFDLVTDCSELEQFLGILSVDETAITHFDVLFPDMREAIASCLRELLTNGVPIKGSVLIYMNNRVQVWPGAGLDAGPSSVRRVVVPRESFRIFLKGYRGEYGGNLRNLSKLIKLH